MSIPFHGQERAHYSPYQPPLSFKFEAVTLLQTKLLNMINETYYPFNLYNDSAFSIKPTLEQCQRWRGQDTQIECKGKEHL